MIFITLGSQMFQFNRLLKEVDRLVEEGIIHDEVFAQIGASDYKPQHYEYTDFLNKEEFDKKMSECTLLITHGGTGAMIGGLKNSKKVIAVPRLPEYKEHVDDHQKQIVTAFNEKKYIYGCEDVKDLERAIKEVPEMHFEQYVSHTDEFIRQLKELIHEYE